MPTQSNWLRRAALLIALVSLTACSTTLSPPKPVLPARLPPPPAELMEPPTSESWSENVAALLRRWLKLLTEPKGV